MSRTNTRVPEEEELITINVDSSERSRARLHLLLSSASSDHRGHGLRLVRPPRVGSTSVDTEAVGSISPDP